MQTDQNRQPREPRFATMPFASSPTRLIARLSRLRPFSPARADDIPVGRDGDHDAQLGRAPAAPETGLPPDIC